MTSSRDNNKGSTLTPALEEEKEFYLIESTLNETQFPPTLIFPDLPKKAKSTNELVFQILTSPEVKKSAHTVQRVRRKNAKNIADDAFPDFYKRNEVGSMLSEAEAACCALNR